MLLMTILLIILAGKSRNLLDPIMDKLFERRENHE